MKKILSLLALGTMLVGCGTHAQAPVSRTQSAVGARAEKSADWFIRGITCNGVMGKSFATRPGVALFMNVVIHISKAASRSLRYEWVGTNGQVTSNQKSFMTTFVNYGVGTMSVIVRDDEGNRDRDSVQFQVYRDGETPKFQVVEPSTEKATSPVIELKI